MLLSKAEITKMFRKAAQVWSRNKDYLSKTDSRFDDGDHDVITDKTAGLIERSLDGWDDDDVETFLEDLGDNTMKIRGGSAGPSYGTMIGGPSGPLEGNKPTDTGTLKEMFTECLSAMEDATNAGVGDKTMMDALISAMEAAQSAGDDVMAVLETVKEVTAKSARESEQYVSKYGGIRSYREKTAGTLDAGAVSISLFFAGLCDGLK